jgi:alpha-beta hydrolase superfamily lysophospholipase
VTLATQSYGTDAVSILNRRCATLVLHGTADEILPAEASQSVYARAHQPKELKLYQGARHGLDEAADQSEAAVREWLLTYVTAR